MERVRGIEPLSSAWKAVIIAIILYPPTRHFAGFIGSLGLIVAPAGRPASLLYLSLSKFLNEFSVKICFLKIALPEPVLKYFSSSLAFCSVATTIYEISLTGLRNFVDSTLPN